MKAVIAPRKLAGGNANDAEADDFARLIIDEIKLGVAHLPAWSKDAERALAETMLNKPSTRRIAQTVTMDASMVVAVMSALRSPLFGAIVAGNTDLPGAIVALGPRRVQALVYAAGLTRLRDAPRLLSWRRELQALITGNINVTSMCLLLAERSGQLSMDEALLLGVLHNVGKYWIYAHLQRAGDWKQDVPTRLRLLSRWHGSIGATALECWNLPPFLPQAVVRQDALDPMPSGHIACDILAAAVIAARTAHRVEETAAHLAEFGSMGMNQQEWRELLQRVPETGAHVNTLFSG